ncbi:MAG: ABC-2 family transporter protein [Candidatus Magasanikbacteria bacterium]|nr:ABC-2 family transporter protein [Candidatus Magasanikbacteria bacterium]
MLTYYLTVYRTLLSNSFSYEAQYRRDTWVKLITNLLWFALLFITIEIIFSQTKSLAGWSKEMVYLLTLWWIMADEAWVTLFGTNLPALAELIVRGDLDAILTKPLPPLFLVSLKIFLVRGFYRLLLEGILFIVLFWKFDFNITPTRVLLAGLLFMATIVINYALSLLANTLNFWWLRLDNINELVGTLHGLGRFPLGIWPKTIKIILLTAIPIGFTAYVPVAALTGQLAWYGILYSFVFAGFLFWLAVRFWNFALKRYSSASS